jgi:prophage DNA circulation protein
MLETTVTLRDVLMFLLFVAGIGALAYLTHVLKRLGDVLKGLERLISTNEHALTEALKSVPAITGDVAVIANTVRKGIEESGDSLPAILRHVDGITGSVDGTLRGVNNTVKGISDTMGVVSSGARDIGAYLDMGAGVASALTRILPAGKKKKKKRWFRQ